MTAITHQNTARLAIAPEASNVPITTRPAVAEHTRGVTVARTQTVATMEEDVVKHARPRAMNMNAAQGAHAQVLRLRVAQHRELELGSMEKLLPTDRALRPLYERCSEHRVKVFRWLLGPSQHLAALLQPADRSLHDAAPPLRPAIERHRSTGPAIVPG